MSDSFQYGDLIFLGLIAIFLGLRLRAMIGRNSGINPREVWKQATRDAGDKTPVFAERAQKKMGVEEDVLPAALRDNFPVTSGLKAIRAADPSFGTTDFIAGARLAFEWVVDAFAAGNKEKLKNLLSDERFQHFGAEIDMRVKDGTHFETTLVSVLATDITQAEMKNGRAQVTVQFTTEQIHVQRDKDKNVSGGDPSAIEKVIDVWTFERDVNSRDPNWKITAT